MISCMGGWCKSRDRCAHYHETSTIVAERLCGEREEPEFVKDYRYLVGGIQAPVSGEVSNQTEARESSASLT